MGAADGRTGGRADARDARPGRGADGGATRPSRSGAGDAARRWTLVRAPRQAVPASVRRFNQRARQRRLRAAAPWLAALGALVLIAAVVVLVGHTSLLGVRAVAVRGNSLVSAEQVRAAAAVPRGTPLAGVDLAGVRRRVGALPAVRRVQVGRHWPSTLVVTVTERTGAAVLARPDRRYDVIDQAGVVFRTVPERPDGLPVVELSSPGPADPSTRAALTVLAALPRAMRDRLVTLSAPSPAGLRLELRDGRQVVWGDDTDNAVKAEVATALLRQSHGRVIDVSAPDTATVR